MNWSVHQYQKPMIAEPNSAPYQGNAASCPLRISVVIESPSWFTGCAPQVAISAFQPPSSRSPSHRITSEPTSRIGVCSTDVFSTDSMPPMMVYTAVMITSASAATQKLIPRSVFSARPPASTVTDTFVST